MFKKFSLLKSLGDGSLMTHEDGMGTAYMWLKNYDTKPNTKIIM